MKQHHNLYIQGVPDNIPEKEAAVCRSRMLTAVNELLENTKIKNVRITVSNFSQKNNQSLEPNKSSSEPSIEERAKKYKSRQPFFKFEQLVVPDSIHEELLSAVDLIQLEPKVFDEWGLREIEPFPRTALNFYGPPGTGKTLAAHAIASHIGRPILLATYAQIESMFHGEGSKNVEALFLAAERDNAVLFIDEADSLLSKRLLHVTQGSEQAINSIRSQLFICLEQFQGIVIFATNLVENYDKAFETRVRYIYFSMPDQKCRREIWRRHLPNKLPLGNDISLDIILDTLAQVDDICGRDIKNAVIDAAMRVARVRKNYIELNDLLDAIERIKAARIAVNSSTREVDSVEKEQISEKIKKAFSQEKSEIS